MRQLCRNSNRHLLHVGGLDVKLCIYNGGFMIYPLHPPPLSFLPRLSVSCSFFFFFVNALTHLWNGLLDGGRRLSIHPRGSPNPGLSFLVVLF